MTTKHEEIIELGKFLYKNHYAKGGSGNISVRLDEKSILVSPSGTRLGFLHPETLSVVDIDSGQYTGPKPTKEVQIHLAFYRNRKDINTVIHLHSTYLTALSCLENLPSDNALRAFTPYYVMRIKKLPVIPYVKPGSQKLVPYVTSLVPKHSAILMANHGILLGDTTSEQASNNFEELEETAKLFFILQNANVRYFNSAEIAELEEIQP